MTPQMPAGTKASASSPCCVTLLALVGQAAVLLPAIWTMTSQMVTGTKASITPFWVVVPLVPVVLQSLEVFAPRPTLTAHRVTGTRALMAPVWLFDAGD